MVAALRLVGIVNAAVWFGAAVCVTLVAGPAFFSKAMLGLLGQAYAGAAAQVMWQKYAVLQYFCGGIALAHLLLEWICSGRPFSRPVLYLLLGLTAFMVWSGVWVQPRMRQLHLVVYGGRATAAQVEQARKSFGHWHGFSMAANLVVLAGLGIYLGHVTRSVPTLRFVSQTKFQLE